MYPAPTDPLALRMTTKHFEYDRLDVTPQWSNRVTDFKDDIVGLATHGCPCIDVV